MALDLNPKFNEYVSIMFPGVRKFWIENLSATHIPKALRENFDDLTVENIPLPTSKEIKSLKTGFAKIPSKKRIDAPSSISSSNQGLRLDSLTEKLKNNKAKYTATFAKKEKSVTGKG